MGAVNQMKRFIPNLAQLCFKLRPLLKKDKPWNWDENHEEDFKEINKQVQKVVECSDTSRKLKTSV